MTIYLAPPAGGAAIPVGGRLYRKQVLKKGPLTYQTSGQTRQLNFDDAYMQRLVGAFRDGAYDSVPFVLADDKNRHTMDPERARGEVVDLEATPEGLDAVVRLSSEASKLVEENPKFGVSARIVEGLTRGDGKSWPHAVQHVLGTFDPRMTGMRPWEAVDLAAEGHDVIDLTDTPTGDVDMAGLSEEDLEALKGLAKVAPSLVGLVFAFDDDDNGDDDGDGESSDDALFEGYTEDDAADQGAGELTGAGVSLSNEDEILFDLSNDDFEGNGDSIELSQMREELDGVRTQLAAEKWKHDKASLIADGVPPVMVEKAEVLLSNPGAASVIELSNGDTVDPAEVVRDLLHTARGLVDLSAPLGHQQDNDHDTQLAALHAEMDKFGDDV